MTHQPLTHILRTPTFQPVTVKAQCCRCQIMGRFVTWMMMVRLQRRCLSFVSPDWLHSFSRSGPLGDIWKLFLWQQRVGPPPHLEAFLKKFLSVFFSFPWKYPRLYQWSMCCLNVVPCKRSATCPADCFISCSFHSFLLFYSLLEYSRKEITHPGNSPCLERPPTPKLSNRGSVIACVMYKREIAGSIPGCAECAPTLCS